VLKKKLPKENPLIHRQKNVHVTEEPIAKPLHIFRKNKGILAISVSKSSFKRGIRKFSGFFVTFLLFLGIHTL
jgi:hypothetical protein